MEDLGLQPAERDELPAVDVDLEVVTALRPGVGSAFLDDEAVLLDPATGASHVLDAPAALVTRLLDGESPLGAIAYDIADVLGAERATVEQDVVGLVRTLGGQGLLEGIARDPRAGLPAPVRPEGLPLGTDLGGWDGWAEIASGEQATLLVNWGTGCGFCTRIAGELAELAPQLAATGTALVLVTTGDEDRLRTQIGELSLPAVFVEEPPDFFAGLGTPAAYLIGSDRTILEPLAVGADTVPGLARGALG